MIELGPVKPVSGMWQVAQANPRGLERVTSKRMSFPSCAAAERGTRFGG